MRLDEWLDFYGKICADLAIDPQGDADSANILSEILGSSSNLSLLEPFRGGDFYVVGNGPEMESTLKEIGNGRTIVADSALTEYMRHRGPPDIVITDLDGDIDSLLDAYNGGSLMIVHAHGDNIPLIRKYSGKFRERVVGTTQVIPLWNVFNFTGFTDGDRGAFLADHLGAGSIFLIGFDFNRVGDKPGIDRARKEIKLKWARILLEKLATERGTVLGEGPVIPL